MKVHALNKSVIYLNTITTNYIQINLITVITNTI